MEFFRRTIGQIKTQLGLLSASQKMVCVLLVVIMIGAFFWLVNYSAQREMVPLFDQSFTEVQLRPIVNKLEGWGEDYLLKGDRILVLKSRQISLIGRLNYANVLPEDTAMGWSSLLEDVDFMTPAFVHEDRKLIKMQQMLGQAIAEMPGVESAKVFINQGSKRRLSNLTPNASASVMITMSSAESDTRKLATSIAAFVSGAVNRMKREDVTVTIGGKLFTIAPVGEQMDSEYLALKATHEQHYRQKILDALNIADTLVQVDATPQITKTRTTKSEILPEEEGSWNPVIDETGREDESTNVTERKEPGMMANVPENAQGGSGPSQKQTSEESTIAKKPFPGHAETFKEIPAGGITDISATVRVPRSYFVGVAQRESDSQDEPSSQNVTAAIERELPILKKSVMLAIGLRTPADDDCVVVNDYWDGIVTVAQAGAATAGIAGAASGPSVAGVAQQYGKHIAVGALAAISLLMMLMMVRKAGGPVDVSDDETALRMGERPLDALGVEESNIDDDGHTAGGLLEGLELNEDTIRSQQILEQVRSLVDDSPQAAASLLKKWIVDAR